MKHVKIIVIQEITVPDDAEITTHPGDLVDCIQVQGRYYMPTIGWLERDEQAEKIGDREVHGWSASERAEQIFSELVSEDGIVHEIKGLPAEEDEEDLDE